MEDLPALPDNLELGGNEIEAVLVRVQRLLACEDETEVKAALAKALSEYRPLPHRAKLWSLWTSKSALTPIFAGKLFPPSHSHPREQRPPIGA